MQYGRCYCLLIGAIIQCRQHAPLLSLHPCVCIGLHPCVCIGAHDDSSCDNVKVSAIRGYFPTSPTRARTTTSDRSPICMYCTVYAGGGEGRLLEHFLTERGTIRQIPWTNSLFLPPLSQKLTSHCGPPWGWVPPIHPLYTSRSY